MNFNHMREVLTALIAAVGINAPVDSLFGGLFLAIAGGYLALIWTPEKDKREVWTIIGTAAVVALFIAIAHPHVLAGVPLQLCMGLGGFVSRHVVVLLNRVSGRAVARSDDIADMAIDRVAGKEKE